VHKAVSLVVTKMYPKRRSSGMLAVLIFVATQSLYCPNGVHIGHAELAEKFGVSPRTLVRRLGEWRNAERLLDRKKRGRQNSHVTWWAAPKGLVKLVAAELRATKPRRRIAGSLRNPKRANTSQVQRANLPQVAALGSQPDSPWRSGPALPPATQPSPAPKTGPVGKTELPDPDIPDKLVGLAAVVKDLGARAGWMRCEHGKMTRTCPACARLARVAAP
jgi:hypothetical protein